MRSVSQVLAFVTIASCAMPYASAQPKPAPATPSATPPASPKAAPPSASTSAGSSVASPSLLPPGAAPVLLAQAVPAPAGAAGGPVATVVQPPAGGDAAPKPPSIDVEDPLLAPVPAAPHVITGFKEVLNLLSNESLTLRIAQQDIERAKGQERVALAGALPSLTATANGSLTPILPTPLFPQPQQRMSGSLSFQLVQPLNPRAWYGIGTAEKTVEATKLRTEDARRQAIAAAANAIVTVVTSERVAEINRVGLRVSLQRLELTKRRKRLGSGTDLDIVRAEQDAATARGQLVSGDENLRKARESLGQLFGKSDAFGVPATFTLNDIEPALKSACKVAKPDERTDVLAAKADLEVAERGVTDVKLAFAPSAQISTTVNLAGGLLESPNTPGLSSISQQSWSIGALLTIPLWDGGARYGQLRSAKANVEQAKTRVEQATNTATVEGTQAQRAVTVAEQARAVSETARDLARETARLSQVAFESGAGTSLDLIDSSRVLRQAELDLAVKELEVVRAKIAALLALSACNL